MVSRHEKLILKFPRMDRDDRRDSYRGYKRSEPYHRRSHRSRSRSRHERRRSRSMERYKAPRNDRDDRYHRERRSGHFRDDRRAQDENKKYHQNERKEKSEEKLEEIEAAKEVNLDEITGDDIAKMLGFNGFNSTKVTGNSVGAVDVKIVRKYRKYMGKKNDFTKEDENNATNPALMDTSVPYPFE
ncbi:hypothetical protein ROZALSC1DRAFT_29729 [Rozella allomycis CSF55]|uniref:U4/U6.U5 small nuclear ribonucleoprotein 27kDa protein domain-containing protein n=1 Tax=Rozella allomycis (strain CSF55) TaxID=988480 RepID=A0A075AX32_ROZAC|nr:hypothetical protein O9G_002021 [Rozella allomycis CSF55]RKP18599.1 hypothetical protein ROZALSC1DRAFT_29729 [Rozella allomycis CSF55]|eukprot:EPZ34890.1 hypothetical protein O9G_002021 [Rozella allomycis CSF55]